MGYALLKGAIGRIKAEYGAPMKVVATGGIASLKTYGRGPNRISQQVAFRFRHERVEQIDEGDEIRELRTFYTRMQRTSANVLSTGPGVGAIETAGTLVDPQTDEVARFDPAQLEAKLLRRSDIPMPQPQIAVLTLDVSGEGM